MTERTRAQLDDVLDGRRDAQQLTTRCNACDWTHTGTASEGRQAAADHRRDTHPALDKPARRRPPRKQGEGMAPALSLGAARLEQKRRRGRASRWAAP